MHKHIIHQWLDLLFFSDFCLLVFWTIVYTTYLCHHFIPRASSSDLIKALYIHLQSLVRCVTFRTSPARFRIGKGMRQGCVLSPCLFNFYVNYIMQNVGLDEAQAGIQIAGRNINKLRYAGVTPLMEESKQELKSLLVKVKEESERAGLKVSIQKTKTMASGPIIWWQIYGEAMETVRDFILGGSKVTEDGDCSHEIQRCLLLGRKVMTNLDSIL